MTQSVPEPPGEGVPAIVPPVELQSGYYLPSDSNPAIAHPALSVPTNSNSTIQTLQVLIIEDSEDDVLLITRELQRGGYLLTYRRVDSRQEMNAALEEQSWDLVIADYNLPHFDAINALRLLQEKALDIPFIIVSGSIGEDTAVAAMKAGAHDYLMKNNLARLVPAVERELREAQERRKRREAEQTLRDSEEWFRSLIENALDIITVLDEAGIIRYVSPSVERVLGYKPEDLVGQVAFDYAHPNDARRILSAFKKAIQSPNQRVSGEFQFRHRDGSWRVLEAVGRQFAESARVYRLVINARDITERKQAEETRKALQKEKELNDLKSRFISMVSHEFRTPLSVIVLSTRLLERFHTVAPEEKQLLYLDRIQAAAKRMTQLLDDVLFLGKTELGKQEFNPSPLELVQFCQDLVEEMQLTISSGHKIHFVCQETSISAWMDEVLLRHIFTNLLSNAIKYSPVNQLIHFELIRQQNWATFRVQDQGIGIPEADRQQLFQSFHRGSNVGKIPGTGLGLAIVYQSVRLHHGTISVESQVEAGTTFTVCLPLYNGPIEEAKKPGEGKGREGKDREE
ncbi:MAG: PAS domain S-box protein [Leptolyngbyaceae cyanobacterium HOT.MB2.61]|nr:PAS domain S-box protein [Leptolyngbyaceae cyanobacterium HOT.MB2.61]